MDSLTIGQVAKRAAVGTETVRFYEREGLLEKPPRRASGYRAYPPDAVNRVRFIKQAKQLGFSLKEIRGLLTLRIAPGTTCGEVKRHSEAKIQEIGDKIRSLQRMARALRKLIDACAGRGKVSQCPILDALQNG